MPDRRRRSAGPVGVGKLGRKAMAAATGFAPKRSVPAAADCLPSRYGAVSAPALDSRRSPGGVVECLALVARENRS